MAVLKPDKTTKFGGVTVNEYLLTKHNPNRIGMPSVPMKGKVIGVTVHNTDWINVASGTTPAEQYTRATVNGNMGDVRVHYYVDNACAWQNLPLILSGWHAADGNGNGNRKTVAIECIMSSAYNDKDKKSEDNCARLAAALLKKYNLDINHLYTHTHWLNIRDGKNGCVDYLNTANNSYKNCPAYILPHWTAFKAKVQSYMGTGTSTSINANVTSSAAAKPDITYCVYTSKWLPTVKNTDDYAGIQKTSVSGLAAKSSKGTLKYRVHTKGGKWLGWISKYDTNNWNTGCAGIKGQPIDAVQMKLEGISGYEVRYRASTTSSTSYLPWVTGTEDYAGILGSNIDCIQAEIVKK